MEQAVLQEKLTSSPFLAGASLPPEQVTAKRFRAGQIISDRPGGVSSVGMIVSGRVEVYSVALDGKDVQLNALTAGECFGVCNLLARHGAGDGIAVRGGDRSPVYPQGWSYSPVWSRTPDLPCAMRPCATGSSRFLLRRIELLTMQSCRGRLIAHLLERQDEVGVVKARRVPGGSGAPSGWQTGPPSSGSCPRSSPWERPQWTGTPSRIEDRPLLEELL